MTAQHCALFLPTHPLFDTSCGSICYPWLWLCNWATIRVPKNQAFLPHLLFIKVLLLEAIFTLLVYSENPTKVHCAATSFFDLHPVCKIFQEAFCLWLMWSCYGVPSQASIRMKSPLWSSYFINSQIKTQQIPPRQQLCFVSGQMPTIHQSPAHPAPRLCKTCP